MAAKHSEDSRHARADRLHAHLDVALFLNRVRHRPKTIEFPDVVALINRHYRFVPTTFVNHDIVNEAGQNSGSCRVFAFARLHDLDRASTLALFGAFYRADVARNPDGTSHPNIRQFMRTGWAAIEFDGVPLRARARR